MKLAIISVSDKGHDLALRLKEKIDSDSTIIKCDLYHKNVRKYFPILFSEYDGIIAIMASGILIR
jgi:cobalt-precorrin 5A hydrolase